MIDFQTVYECMICHPVEGMIINDCVVKLSQKQVMQKLSMKMVLFLSPFLLQEIIILMTMLFPR